MRPRPPLVGRHGRLAPSQGNRPEPVRIPAAVLALACALPAAVLALACTLPADLTAQWPGEIRGRVVDAVTGTGVPGARIETRGLALLTDGDGGFRLRGLDPGEALVRAIRAGYFPVEREARVHPGRTASLTLELHPRPLPVEGFRVEGDRASRPGAVRLDAEAIRASGAATLGELLEAVPGVTIVRRGPGGPEIPILRGATGDQVLLLVDGVRLNDPVTGDAELSRIALTGVREVEVIPGAGSARWGPGALAGVIRVSTGEGRSGLEATARAGSLGDRGLLLDARALAGPLALRAATGLGRMDGGFPFALDPEVGGGHDRRGNADLAREDATLGAAGPLAGGRWDVQASAERLARGIPGKSYAPSDSARQTETRRAARARWERSGSPATVRIRLGADRRSSRFRDPQPPLGPAFDHTSRVLTLDAGLEVDGLRPGTDLVALGAGVDVRRQRIRADALDAAADRPRTHAGVFVHGEMRAGEKRAREGRAAGALSPALSGALRVDHDPTGASPVVSHDVTLHIAPGPLRLHASHRSSFSPPSAGDQFYREGVGVVPNPDLRPERVRGELEAGGSFAVGTPVGELHLAAAAFRADLRDMIQWAPDFRFVWSPRNVDVRRRGAELRADLRHPSGLRLGGDVTRVRLRLDRGPNAPEGRVPYRPAVTGGIRAGWSGGETTLELGARHIGVRYPSPTPVNALPAFWTLDAGVSTRVRARGWWIRPALRVDRLFDERDAFIFAVPEPGRVFRLEVGLRRGP